MPLPERLGRLRRIRPLGHGGFATVWLYRDDELRSDVAVKALAENWCQRLDIRERFLEEARILRAADADNVVRVHDLGETEGTPWFVMTYADRGSLDVALTGEPWPPDDALPLLDQAAAGLAVLHAQGVVHRDVKPQNLLLRSPGGREERSGDAGPRRPGELTDSLLMVADLGVAKAVLHASGLTQVVGTPAYMAPEQAEATGVDPRADVHALGAVAYQLLTGRLLRDGSLAALMEGRPPVPPSALAPLPRAVDDVVLRAVATRPEERWDDVGSFVRALREAAHDAGPLGVLGPRPAAPPATSSGTVVRGSGRPAAGVVVALVLLVLGLSFGAAFGVVALLR